MNRAYLDIVIALVFFAVALVCYGFWHAALGSLSQNVGELTAQVAAKNQDAALALVAEDELAKLSVEEGAIRGYFVMPGDIVSFLESIQSLGSSAGAKVDVVSVTANPAPRPHLDLALKISGTFDAVMRAVGAIEYSPHDIVVSTLTLDTDQSAGATASSGWTAAFVMQVGTASSSPAVPATESSSTPPTP